MPVPRKIASFVSLFISFVLLPPFSDIVTQPAKAQPTVWTRLSSGTTNELRAVHFASEMEGWAAGAQATLLKTTNGGTSWAAVNTGADAARGFNTVRFLDRNVGWVSGTGAHVRTVNGGANWAAVNLPTDFFLVTNGVYRSFFPTSATGGWAVGGYTTSGGSPFSFLVTYSLDANGNVSRGETTVFSLGPLLDAYFSAGGMGLAVGAEGLIVRRVNNPPFPLPNSTIVSSGTSQSLNALHLSDSNNGWVVGNNGTILKTSNGGSTWSAQTSGATTNLRGVHFLDANRGWIVGDGGLILTTSNGGSSWTPEASGVTNNLRSVFFVNEITGFAVGDNSVILKRGAATVGALSTVSAASFSGAELASESIAAAFGANLTNTTQAATTLPLPTTLGGLSLKVRDSAGTDRLAPLFFVSPGQLNYQIPAGTASGRANLSVLRDGTETAAGAAQIAAVAPGVFAANANGQDVAAALALRVRGAEQTTEPVARFDQTANRWVPVPINLGPEGEQVFLILFGTGLRGRSALSAVTCTIGGMSVPVTFAGAVSGFIGLDQVNVGPLPRNLAGRGAVDVVLMVDGKAANTVRINIG